MRITKFYNHSNKMAVAQLIKNIYFKTLIDYPKKIDSSNFSHNFTTLIISMVSG